MAEPILLKRDSLPVAEIEAGYRLRPVSEAAVESLVASITELGVMKDAVHVRQKKSGALVLIAGAHRLEAARRLGWSEIPAKVWTNVTDDWAQLMEVDDNIAGAELNALDTAVFLATRKAVYERLHPESRRGVSGALARWDATDIMSVASFSKATAEKFGLTDRHVRRLVSIGSRLEADEIDQLRKAERAVTLKDLAALSKIGEPDERRQVVLKLAVGNAKSATAARKALAEELHGPRQELPPEDLAFDRLCDLWTRASAANKRRFALRYHGAIEAALESPVPRGRK